MKKRSLLTLVFASMFALTIPALASAASVGNPDTLGQPGAIALGLEYDSSHTNMELKNVGNVDGNAFGSHDMQLDSKTMFATITVGILPQLDAFAGIGMNNSDLGFDMTSGDWTDNIMLKDNAVTAYKVGVKGKVAEVAGIQIGASAQYSGMRMDKKFLVNGEDLSTLFYNPDAPSTPYTTKTKIHRWQAAVTASKQMGRFNPYAGLILAKVSADHNTVVNVAAGEGPAYSVAVNAEARQESLYTGVIGANASIVENLDANIEFRSGNEDAFTAALNYKF